MNGFLELKGTWEKTPELKALNDCSKAFWSIPLKDASAIFAQRGYEEKGCGHIDRIIVNVLQLLEEYSHTLWQLNNPGGKGQNAAGQGKEAFQKKLVELLEPNLILFYVSAHLHDIGMEFAGIFKSLTELVTGGVNHALHIGEVIHDYHHYSTFIVLLELNNLIENTNNDASISHLCPYLKDIKGQERLFSLLKCFYNCLEGIFNNVPQIKNFFEDKDEFFVALGTLCLLHKEVNPDYIQSITRKYKADQHQKGILRHFKKWWQFLDDANVWTKKTLKIIPEINNFIKSFSGSDEIVAKPTAQGKGKLDLLFVEALLQYGDKTDITIDRLIRNHIWEESGSKEKSPLDRFIEDTRFDNQKGFICTDIAQRVISSFARFRACRFIPLIQAQVQGEVIKGQGKLAIVFHYLRFRSDEDIFRIIRYHNEKDFYTLGFLDIIRIHLPMLLNDLKDEEKLMENPIMNFEFKKNEHKLPALGDEQRKLLATPLKKVNKEEKPNTSTTVDKAKNHQEIIDENEAYKVVAEFLLGNNIKRTLVQAIEKQIKEKQDSDYPNDIESGLYEQFQGYLKEIEGSTSVDETLKEGKQRIINEKEAEERVFKDYFAYIKKEDQIDLFPDHTVGGDQQKIQLESPINLANRLYVELRIRFILFLECQIEGDSKNFTFLGSIKKLLEGDDKDGKISKGIMCLHKAIYKESLIDVSPKVLFPYTAQNRKAIRDASQSILNPEKRKKIEGIKKAIFETSDIVVPSSFETMAILNLFQEEV